VTVMALLRNPEGVAPGRIGTTESLLRLSRGEGKREKTGWSQTDVSPGQPIQMEALS